MRHLEMTAKHLSDQIQELGVFSSRIRGQKPFVTIELLQTLYEQSKAVTLAIDSYRNPLLSKMKEASDLEKSIKRCLEHNTDETEMIRIKNEAYQLGVRITGLNEIEEKIELSRKISASIENERCSVEQLKEKLEIARNNKLESILISDIGDKIFQAEIYQQHAIILSSKRKFSLQDIKKCFSLLQVSKDSHLNFNEKQNLIAVLRSFKWFCKLAELHFAVNNRADTIIKEKSIRQLLERLNQEALSLITEETLEGLIERCGNSKKVFEMLTWVQDVLIELLNEADSLQHLDIRIQELSRHYLQEYWRHQATSLLDLKEIDPSELAKLRDRAKALEVDSKDHTFVQLEGKFIKYTQWMEKYTETLYLKDLRSICEPKVIQRKHKILQELSNTYETLNVTLKHAINAVRYVLQVMEWCFAAENCVARIRDKKKVTYESIKQLFVITHDMQLPTNFFYLEDVEAIYMSTSKIIEEALDFFQKMIVKPATDGNEYDKAENIPTGSIDSEKQIFRTDYYDREFQKYPFAKVLALSDRLDNSNVIFEKDLERFQQYIQEYQVLSKNVSELLVRYKFEENMFNSTSFNASFYMDRLNRIVQELDTLKRELSKQIMCDTNVEFQLLCFEWGLAALLLLQRRRLTDLVSSAIQPSSETPQFKGSPLEIWDSLFKVLTKYQHENSYSSLCQKILDSAVHWSLTRTYSKAVEQSNLINRIQAVENILKQKNENSDLNGERDNNRDSVKTLDEVKTLLNQLENSPIFLKEGIDYLNDLLNRFNGFSKQFASAFAHSKGKKPTHSQTEKLLGQFLSLPLSSDKEITLSKALKAYDIVEENFLKVKETTNRSSRTPKKVYSRLAEFIAMRSKECPISHPEAEVVEREYTNCMQQLEAIEAFLNTNSQPSTEDILKKYKILARFRIDFGFWELSLREQCWFKLTDVLKAQYLRTQEHERIHQTNEFEKPLKFTYEVLKELLSDGYQFLDNRSIKTVNFTEFKDTIGNLENLINLVEDKLRLIYEKHSIKELDNFPLIAEDFVDLRPEIATQKERIQNGTQEFPRFVSALRNSSRMLQSNPKLYGAVMPKSINTENQKEQEDSMMDVESDKMSANSKKAKKPRDIKGKTDFEEEEKEATKKIKTGLATNVDVIVEPQPVGKRLRNLALKDFRVVFEKSGLIRTKNKDKTIESVAKKLEENIFSLFGDNSPEYSLVLKKYCENVSKMSKFSSLSKFVSDHVENLECMSSILKEELPLVELDKIIKSNPSIKPRELMKTAELKPDGVIIIQDEMDDQIKIEEQDDVDQILKELHSRKLPKMHFKADPELDLKNPDHAGETKEKEKSVSLRRGLREIFSSVDPQIEAIYQLHYGEFKFFDEAEQDIDGHMITSLFTYEPEVKIRRAPKLPNSKQCIFKAKVEKKAMDEYLTKLHQRELPDHLVIVGWFHDLNNDTRTLDKIAEKYQRDGVVGRSKYLDCATLYALHYQDINLSWTNSNLIQSLNKSSPGVSKLAFVLVSKNYVPNLDRPPLDPLSLYQARPKYSASKQGQIEAVSDGSTGVFTQHNRQRDETFLGANKQNTMNLITNEKQSFNNQQTVSKTEDQTENLSNKNLGEHCLPSGDYTGLISSQNAISLKNVSQTALAEGNKVQSLMSNPETGKTILAPSHEVMIIEDNDLPYDEQQHHNAN